MLYALATSLHKGLLAATGSADAATQLGEMLAATTRYFAGSFTRDTATASGTQAVSGVGFQPTGIIFAYAVPGAIRAGIGFSSGTSNNVGIYDDGNTAAGTWGILTANAIYLESGGGNNYTGKILTFGVDGFTMTWTRTGVPTGTATIAYLAMR